MPDYYFRATISGFLLGAKKKPTEEEVERYIREDINAHDIDIDEIKEG